MHMCLAVPLINGFCYLHLMRWQLGGEDAKPLLQRDPFSAKFVIR